MDDGWAWWSKGIIKFLANTRLISIVSKPIKVVVVVVAIVVVFFCQKKLGPKDCDPKTIHAHKTLSQKVFNPKKI